MAAARLLVLLACFLGLAGYVAASADVSNNGIPSCAVNCILQEIVHSPCSLANQTCMCSDTVLANKVQDCAMANCTVKEMLVAHNQTLAACGVPMAQHDTIMRWFRALVFALPTLFILVRLINKYMKLSTWGWDDATIVAAYIFLAAFVPAGYLSEENGAGRDIWVLTPDQINEFLLLFLIYGLLYMTCLAAIKSSILFFYLRIFPDTSCRKLLWYTQVFNLLLWIACVGVTFGSCRPLHYFWLGWAGEMEGRCIDLNAFGLSHGAFNVVMDLWMLILPVTQVWNLRIQRKEKIGVMIMFSFGAFLTAVSAYRIKAVMLFATSYNVTADSFQSSLWSTIELSVGIFVACLPSARQVWRIMFPRILEATQLSRSARSANGYNSGSKASGTASKPPHRRRAASCEDEEEKGGEGEESPIAGHGERNCNNNNHNTYDDFITMYEVDLKDVASEPDSPSTPVKAGKMKARSPSSSRREK